jgi:1,4-dihydroxy-2-naphthoate octaprenyltransferase
MLEKINAFINSFSNNKALKRGLLLLFMPQPKFLLPGAIPIILGTCIGYSVSGQFHPLLAVLALLSTVAFNAGANMTNDYYDHLSGNDWLTKHTNQFSGGSRYITKGLVSPQLMRAASLLTLGFACFVGLVIVYLTKSYVILGLGIAALIGGYFWTAPPVRWCYKFIGEPYIFCVFGILPVFGAYYLQTGQFGWDFLFPAIIIGIHIALVLLINTFPDYHADIQVNKKTLVVRYGFSTAITVYQIAMTCSYFIAVMGMLIKPQMIIPGFLYLLTIPLAVNALRLATKHHLADPHNTLPNKMTMLLHSVAGLALSAGFLIRAAKAAGL